MNLFLNFVRGHATLDKDKDGMVGLEEFIEYMEKATLDRTLINDTSACRKSLFSS